MEVRCSRCDGWGRPAGGGRCVCDGTGTTSARTVYRIEAHAGARRLDAYVIPPEKASKRSAPALSRFDRLDPPAAEVSYDGEVIIGLDLGRDDAAWVMAMRRAGGGYRVWTSP